MKSVTILKAVAFLIVTVLGIGFISASFNSQKSAAQNNTAQTAFYNRVKEAAGSEISFPSRGDSIEQARNSIETLNTFMYNRSGLTMDRMVKERLAQMEVDNLNGKLPTITGYKLADALTNMVLSKIARMSDEEIQQAVGALCFKPALNTADFNQSYIKLRASQVRKMTPQELIDNLKALRTSSAQKVAKGFVYNFIRDQINSRLVVLSAASPAKFSTLWNRTNNTSGTLTPSQAFLVTYSVISDDLLADNTVNLRTRLDKDYNFFQQTDRNYPSPAGFFAYGERGYEYSTPVSTLLDPQSQAELLNNLISTTE